MTKAEIIQEIHKRATKDGQKDPIDCAWSAFSEADEQLDNAINIGAISYFFTHSRDLWLNLAAQIVRVLEVEE